MIKPMMEKRKETQRLMVFWPLIVALCYIVGDYTLSGSKLAHAEDRMAVHSIQHEKDIDELKDEDKHNVTQQILDLTIEPIHRQLNAQGATIERIETNTYQTQQDIKQILKALNSQSRIEAHGS
jgi:hypothetical protein